MNDIVNIISTIGFPITSCLLYMCYIYKDKQQTREENLKRMEEYKLERDEFVLASNAFIVMKKMEVYLL